MPLGRWRRWVLMSDLIIRPARPDELDAVGELTVRAYVAAGYFQEGVARPYRAHLGDARSRAEQAELWVAVDADSHLLGTVTVALPGTAYAEVSRPGELEFRMLAVDPEVGRRGVGGALIQAVLDSARERGIGRVVLCTQDSMVGVRRIYEKLGFRRLPERDWRPLPDVGLVAYGLDLVSS
jgi:ribosomal protein S18 acetylase RimI-like enzyme